MSTVHSSYFCPFSTFPKRLLINVNNNDLSTVDGSVGPGEYKSICIVTRLGETSKFTTGDR